MKVYIESDTAYLILMALFSLSNGYLGSIVMTFGPKMMTNPHEQGQAASLLVRNTLNPKGLFINDVTQVTLCKKALVEQAIFNERGQKIFIFP